MFSNKNREEFPKQNKTSLPTSCPEALLLVILRNLLIKVSNQDSFYHVHSIVNSGPLPTKEGRKKKLDDRKIKTKGHHLWIT